MTVPDWAYVDQEDTAVTDSTSGSFTEKAKAAFEGSWRRSRRWRARPGTRRVTWPTKTWDKTKDVTGDVADKVQDVAGNVSDKVKGGADDAGDTAEEAGKGQGRGGDVADAKADGER